MSAVEIPPGGTILDTFKKSFSDVPVNAEKDNAISTTEFLDAAESLTTIFGSCCCCSPHACLHLYVPSLTCCRSDQSI